MQTDNPQLPTPFPENWAESYAQDGYGLWQGVYLGDLEIRFRWIPPGSFLMGSPEDEEGRYSDEGPQQHITFESGYWLAETACSRAAWQMVMGDKPSEEGDRPQEEISWQQSQDFISALNEQKTGLECRLPSEAEWEYACRAATRTPFWFGSELTTEQANYDGNHPYAGGEKGVYRGKTVLVKEFLPNPWGLYQMHGNVWEWCEDYWNDGHEGADPAGLARGKGDSDYHVCRGGSWFDYGRNLRSACRRNWPPGIDYTGFRLARGPQASQ